MWISVDANVTVRLSCIARRGCALAVAISMVTLPPPPKPAAHAKPCRPCHILPPMPTPETANAPWCRPVNQCTLTGQVLRARDAANGPRFPPLRGRTRAPGQNTAGDGRLTRARCRRPDSRGADLRLPPGPRIGSAKHASPAKVELSPFRTDWQSVHEHAVGLPNPHASWHACGTAGMSYAEALWSPPALCCARNLRSGMHPPNALYVMPRHPRRRAPGRPPETSCVRYARTSFG